MVLRTSPSTSSSKAPESNCNITSGRAHSAGLARRHSAMHLKNQYPPRIRRAGHLPLCFTFHLQVRLILGPSTHCSFGTRCIKYFCIMPSIVMRSPLFNVTVLSALSPGSGWLHRIPNFLVTPRDSDRIRMSWNLPLKIFSSSECQPTDPFPSS